MTDLSNYKKLSEIDHVLTRSGMYLGSVENEVGDHYIVSDGKMIQKQLEFNPALLKMFDEIVSNSVDEHTRSGNVTQIRISVCQMTGSISVKDNGGIPVKKHPEYEQYIPSMIFGELRSGSNFSDEQRFSAGLNGLGSKLTSIFSKEFVVETSDGKKNFYQKFEDNLTVKNDPKIIPSNSRGTKITFLPDYDRLQCTMSQGNFEKIKKRAYDIAGCNPGIDVWFNEVKIKIKDFGDYVKSYVDNFIIESGDNWVVAVGATDSSDSFKHVSFVNGVDTFNGGTHIDYVVNQITSALRDRIKKKHKVDVKPNNIKQQLMVFINCKINAPTFTSQTKEFMSSSVSKYGTEYEPSESFINALMKSSIIQKVLDWVEAQQRMKEMAELRRMNKQTKKGSLKHIVKFDDATGKKRSDSVLFLLEGDSAAKTVLSARTASTMGVYPLKGKPLNVRDIKIAKLTSSDEFANLMAIQGLEIKEGETDIKDLRFGKLIIAADQDPDGNHICGLIINMFQQFWPELLKQGYLYRLNTPLIIATAGKKQYEFFTRSEYEKWCGKKIKHKMKYYKGLGTHSTQGFKKYLNDESYHEPIVFEDDSDYSCIDLAFDKRKSDERKTWLKTQVDEQ